MEYGNRSPACLVLDAEDLVVCALTLHENGYMYGIGSQDQEDVVTRMFVSKLHRLVSIPFCWEPLVQRT